MRVYWPNSLKSNFLRLNAKKIVSNIYNTFSGLGKYMIEREKQKLVI